MNEFHFTEPLWFYLLVPLALLVAAIGSRKGSATLWRNVCDAHLLPHLLVEAGGRSNRSVLWLVASAWLLSVLALANPVWEKQPRPVFLSQQGRVIVLDLSQSMQTPDLTPSRLTRSRYKVKEILSRSEEGQIGLVAFAGDAFAVSPLTQDADTIDAMLDALEPNIMPVQGSRADLGLLKAGELLRQAGLDRGEILLIADGFDGADTLQIARNLNAQGFTLSVLGVGTKQGAPLPAAGGGFMRDAAGQIVVPRLDSQRLQDLATAGGGRYTSITNSNADLDRLLIDNTGVLDQQTEETGLSQDAWLERGPWVTLLLLPIAALAFRRGWLLSLILVLPSGTLLTPGTALAFGWNDLWQRSDQQAEAALRAGDPAKAAELAVDPMRRGSANYRNRAFDQALESFTQSEGADADYNRGNALARLGRYSEAISAYEKALSQRPDMEDARHNKALLEKLLSAQQQQAQSNKNTEPGQRNEDGQNQTGENAAAEESGEDGRNRSSGTDAKGGSKDEENSESQAQDPAYSDADGSHAEEQQSQGDPGAEQSYGRDLAETHTAESNEQHTSQAADGTGEGRQEDEATDNSATQETLEERKSEVADREPNNGINDTEQKALTEEQHPTGVGPKRENLAATTTMETEEAQAMEQWLRKIPDDPGGLLRRKFLYQYRQRHNPQAADTNRPW